MKTCLYLALACASAVASAQTSPNTPQSGNNAPSGGGAGSQTTRMSNAAIGEVRSALKGGKTVTMTVNNRAVSFAPRLIGNMVFVPVRFFAETGQRVIWDPSDMRATVRQETGPQKNSIEYDARRGQATFQPGASMRPVYEKGRLWVPLASGLQSFGLLAEWVPTSSRINVRTNDRS